MLLTWMRSIMDATYLGEVDYGCYSFIIIIIVLLYFECSFENYLECNGTISLWPR